MKQQKILTPLILRKKNADDFQVSMRASEVRNSPNINFNLVPTQKIKSNPSFSLDKMSTRTLQIAKTSLFSQKKTDLKLPLIRTRHNPQDEPHLPELVKLEKSDSKLQSTRQYYQSTLLRCLKKHQTTYMMNLYRQHFYQTIQVLRFGKSIKVAQPKKQIKLNKKNPAFKTVFLDMDETLIHCDERSSNYTVKLNFPIEQGGILAAGIRVRPFCEEFLKQLSTFAEIIIFTASSASYADVVLDYLDPEKKLISHRLYRQHCTQEKGFYLKDLRIVNRKIQQSILVDNSPYCHILQPDNAIPIVPFFHFNKDRQFQHLLPFLRTVLAAEDVRNVVKSTFFWDKYSNQSGDPRKIFLKYYRQE